MHRRVDQWIDIAFLTINILIGKISFFYWKVIYNCYGIHYTLMVQRKIALNGR